MAIKSIAILSIMMVASLGYTQIPDTLWTKIYGGEMNDWGCSVQQTTDGGFIIAGVCNQLVGNSDFYLIKTNENGDTLWTRKYGTDNDDIGRCVQQTDDGGYIIVGSTDWMSQSEHAYLIKTDHNGDTLWTKTYVGSFSEGWSVQETADGGYVIIGTLLAYPNDDVYLIKTDSLGDILWTKTYGGSANDRGWCGQQTNDGGYIITGYTQSYGVGSADIYLIKTDGDGDTLWTNTWGDYGHWCNGNSVQQTIDGGYIIAGRAWSSYLDYARDLLIKTDQTGNESWARSYHYGGYQAGAQSAEETADGNYIVTGHQEIMSSVELTLFKVDSSGNLLWSKYLGGPAGDKGYAVRQIDDGGFIVTGGYGTANWGADVYLIRVESEFGIEENEYPAINQGNYHSRIFFGPLQLPEGKKCKVFDIIGRVMAPDKLQPGIYFIEIDGIVTQKVVKVR